MIPCFLRHRHIGGSARTVSRCQLFALAAGAVLGCTSAAQEKSPAHPAPADMEVAWMRDAAPRLIHELVARHGDAQKACLERGLSQVAQLWRPDDGDQTSFEEFVRTNFAGDAATLDTMFNRFEHLQEQLDGHMQEISREFSQQLDLEAGPILPFDEMFGGYDPAAHVLEDFFQNKLAFVVLLNFPLTTLAERLQDGATWSRRQWAEVRLAQRFAKRIPANVNLDYAAAAARAGQYIAEYNIWSHHLLDVQGRRLFPAGQRLLCHWNLRDEIKADYADAQAGLAKQRVLQRVMERIVTQTIPAAVVDNPGVDWNPLTNAVTPSGVQDADAGAVKSALGGDAAEPNTRYVMLARMFAAAREIDPYSPTARTQLDRQFSEELEIPEARVQAMLQQVLTSPLVVQTAQLIVSRLGRPLEPFDLWYNGFRPGSQYSEAELDALVASRYPTAAAFQQDIPNLLQRLGFPAERAAYVAANIVVDPARGSGHAMGAAMRTAKVHLRTRIGKNGMNYKAFNIAVHEMGHNVEQTFSLNEVDHTLLRGVPSNACTEALAFVFQGHDLELLGLPAPDARRTAEKALNEFWSAYEIAGVALVDIGVWHWMYDHPAATPAELNAATVRTAKEIWNLYYAPVFRKRDVVLLGIYSHMIELPLYLPHYLIGSFIANQLEEQMPQAGGIGPEFERIAKMGRVTPDLWMIHATGKPVGPEALLTATQQALVTVRAGH